MTDKKTFLKGAFVLVVANIIVKVIGAVFKIPLARLIGNEGMGLFSTTYSVYAWVFVLATAGLPVAVSKMVSESYARGRVSETKKILRASVFLMVIIGGTASFLLYRFAHPLSMMLGNPEAEHSFKVVAPSVLFLSLTAALRGFFQGRQDMVPTAVSEVVEAVGKLIAGILFAGMFAKHGISFAAAGAMLGVCIGELMGFISMALMYLLKKNKLFDGQGKKDDAGMLRIIGRIIALAVPVTIGASVFSLANVADTATIMRRLTAAGLTYNDALSAWGAYSGFAVPLFNMPTSLLSAVSICVVPAVASAFAANKNSVFARQTTLSALRLTLLFALPCAVGLALLSRPVLLLVYKNADATATLSVLGYAVVPVAMSLVSGAVLQSTGNVMLPVRNMLAGAAVKLLVNYLLVGVPGINILGAPVATLMCYIVIMILNLLSVKRILRINFPASDFLVRPVVAVAGMSLAVTYLYKALPKGNMATFVIIAAGAAVYAAMLFVTGAVKEEDIRILPKGRTLAYTLKKTGMIRK